MKNQGDVVAPGGAEDPVCCGRQQTCGRRRRVSLQGIGRYANDHPDIMLMLVPTNSFYWPTGWHAGDSPRRLSSDGSPCEMNATHTPSSGSDLQNNALFMPDASRASLNRSL